MTRASDLAKLLSGGTISTADNGTQLTLESTDTDANAGPHLRLYRSVAGADSDNLGQIEFSGQDDAGNEFKYAQIESFLVDASNGTEDGYLEFQVGHGGTERVSRLLFSGTEAVINQDSKDLDFRVESNGNANMLFVNGGTDRVGIGTNSPDNLLHIKTTGSTPSIELEQDAGTSYKALIKLAGNDLEIKGSSGSLEFYNGSQDGDSSAIRMRINSSGNVYVNNDGSSPLNGRFTVYNDTSQDAVKTYQATSGTTGLWTRIDHTASYFAIFRYQTSTVGSITTNGSATTYGTSSDYRLKENLEYSFDATTRLKQLKPCRFNWIADDTNTLVDGFIAHEVSSVVPEAIHGKKDAVKEEVLYVDGDEIPDGKKIGDVKEASEIIPQAIDQSKLVPLLVKTIQELEARITALESA